MGIISNLFKKNDNDNVVSDIVAQYDYITSSHYKGYKRTSSVKDNTGQFDELFNKHNDSLKKLPASLVIHKDHAELIIDGYVASRIYSNSPYYSEIMNGKVKNLYVEFRDLDTKNEADKHIKLLIEL